MHRPQTDRMKIAIRVAPPQVTDLDKSMYLSIIGPPLLSWPMLIRREVKCCQLSISVDLP